MLRRKEPLLSSEELRGTLLLLLMSIASNVEAIRGEVVGDDGEENDERE